MFDDIRSDMSAYANDGGWYSHLGFYITATYRFGCWARGISPAPLRLACMATHRALATPWRLLRNVYLPASAEIGPGFRMVHAHSVLVPPDAKIGANCSIYHEVTLGTGPCPGVPTVGDDVMIFAGAKLLGGVVIGDRVHVGANAVVTKDVPAGATVAVSPTRIIPRDIAQSIRT